MLTGVLEKRTSLRQAAKAARKSERFIRELIEAGHLRAWREGTQSRARFFVLLDEVEPAILAATEYTPAAKKPGVRTGAFKHSPVSHPDVRC